MPRRGAQANFQTSRYTSQPVEENLFQWTPQENAFLHAIGYRVWDGHQLVPLLDAIAAMDRRLAHERKRLRDAARDKKVALRSEIFASVYEYGNGTAIGKVFRSVQIGLFHRTEEASSPRLSTSAFSGTISPMASFTFFWPSAGVSWRTGRPSHRFYRTCCVDIGVVPRTTFGSVYWKQRNFADAQPRPTVSILFRRSKNCLHRSTRSYQGR